MVDTTNAAHMPVAAAWLSDSPLIELPVMQRTTCAVQLLWEGALVAAHSGYCWCLWMCVHMCVSMYCYAVAVAHTRCWVCKCQHQDQKSGRP